MEIGIVNRTDNIARSLYVLALAWLPIVHYRSRQTAKQLAQE